jgi:uncharacterized alkaline shock family protein YloU
MPIVSPEVAPRVPTDQPAGRLLVSRGAVADLIRSATLGSYGVAGFAGTLPERLLGRLGLASPGLRVGWKDGLLHVDLYLEVGHGLPIAEVARQVDSAVRYSVRRALGREIARVAVHVDRLRFETGVAPAEAAAGPAVPAAADLAGSGTDVA